VNPSSGTVLENILQVENLSYQYGVKKALDSLSFSVGAGEIFGFLGPNGGGKTTAFKLLSTLFPCRPGEVQAFGLDLSKDKTTLRGRMGVVFQQPALDRKLTVEENLRYQGRLYGLGGGLLGQRVARDLGRLGLLERAQDRVETLSGGLQRRVELAKSLLNDPKLLVLDEPSTGLDPAARREFWDHLEALRKEQGMTVLVTTHYLEEADRCDRILILEGGRSVALGSPEELKAGIGGEVLRLKVRDPQGMEERLSKDLKVKVLRVGDLLQLEDPKAHRFVTPLMEGYPDQVTSLTLGPPTLEDVFLHRTGRRLYSEESR
jgi:ABC-2 type transport system ATP-binding protein